MCISVVFPAPFSPRSAWISPTPSWKSTCSFATTPGKRLVIPCISNAKVMCVPRLTVQGLPRHSSLNRTRLQDSGDLLQPHLYSLRNGTLSVVEGRQANTVVAGVKHLPATLERALDGHFDRPIDRVVDAFHGARKQLVGAFGLALFKRGQVFILIHSDDPRTGLGCSENSPRAGGAATTENHISPLVHLRQRRRFPTRWIRKTVDVHAQELARSADMFSTSFIALAEPDHRRDFYASDHANGVCLGHHASQCPGEKARLVLGEGQANDIGYRRVIRKIDNSEQQLGIFLGHLLRGITQHKADRHAPLVARQGELLNIFLVVRWLLRLDEGALEPELFDSAHHPLIGELVKSPVVDLPDISHQTHLRDTRQRRARQTPEQQDQDCDPAQQMQCTTSHDGS